jgi:uncharacterized protein YkwD
LVTDPAILAQRILAAHNGVRTRYGAPALVWDKGLSVDAAAYVRSMAATGRFEHANQKAQGENLWMGSAGFYTIEDMTGSWAAESQLFRAGRFPDVSTHGGWTAVGHFTQMIWPSTTHVGCAIARNQTDDYLVCRYRPAGNIIGTNLP